MNRRAAVLVALALPALACSSGGADAGSGAAPAATASVEPLPTAAPQAAVRAPFEIVSFLPMCDVEHRGLLLDAGEDALVGRAGWDLAPPQGVTRAEHGGATWARVSQRSLPLTFVLPESTRLFVSTRALGKAARSASVYLDDQPLGTLTFSRAAPKVVSTGTTTLPADAGLHTVTLRFTGRARDDEPFADLDWIRIGVPDETSATFGALTMRDLVVPNAALSGVPHRAISLRAPGSLRCALRPAASSVLDVAVGMSSPGEGSVALAVTRDGQKPEIVAQAKVTGGDKATWSDLRASLAPFAGQVVTLSLVAERAPKGGRLLFGDPRITDTSAAPAPAPAARAVVIVALDGVERTDLPPWSQASPDTLPTLSDLAQSSTVFTAHRAPSTVVTTVMASLVTGLSPAAHTLTDPAIRLPETQTTMAEIARDAAVRTGMFTGVPYTFKAFGLAQGWENLFEHAPTSGDAATMPLDTAATWVTQLTHEDPNARMLLLVHARGGHPPWHVTPKELSAVQPTDYSGPIEPRRAAQTIAKARKKRNRDVLSQADRDRIHALQMVALAGQDRAIGNLVAALKTAGLWDATLFVVTGDVASGSSMAALFGDGLPLAEPLLTLPLYVHFPGGQHAGTRVAEPTEVTDITRTAFAVLGLDPGKRGGRDLAQIASGVSLGPSQPQIATLETTYSARWGSLVLTGRSGAPPFLCDLSLDPTCAVNRREAMPAAVHALFRRIVAADRAARPMAEQRELATVDADTAAQLKVWGAVAE